MTFDPQGLFANLAEKERLKGHHSAEGRAIRTLSRAMNGWSSGDLAALDVVVLCDQSLEDWLKARLRVSAWSTQDFPALLEKAVLSGLVTHRSRALAEVSQRVPARAWRRKCYRR